MKFDIDGMQRNVLPLINTANKGIENIEAKINAITIPSKLKSKDKIQSLKGKVGNVKAKVLGSGIRNGLAGKIEAKIAKVQNAESSNKALLDGVGLGIFKNLDDAKKYIKDTSDSVNKNLGKSYTLSTSSEVKKKKIAKPSSIGSAKNRFMEVKNNKPNYISSTSDKINKNLGDSYKIYDNKGKATFHGRRIVTPGIIMKFLETKRRIELGNKVVRIPDTETEAPWKDTNLNPYIGIGSERSMYMVCLGKVL